MELIPELLNTAQRNLTWWPIVSGFSNWLDRCLGFDRSPPEEFWNSTKELEEDPEDLIGEGDLDPDREKDLELFLIGDRLRRSIEW
jgi:hypothetical protein